MLVNRFEEPDSKITSLTAGALERYDPSVDEFFELTRDEQVKPGYVGKILVLESIPDHGTGLGTRFAHVASGLYEAVFEVSRFDEIFSSSLKIH